MATNNQTLVSRWMMDQNTIMRLLIFRAIKGVSCKEYLCQPDEQHPVYVNCSRYSIYIIYLYANISASYLLLLINSTDNNKLVLNMFK